MNAETSRGSAFSCLNRSLFRGTEGTVVGRNEGGELLWPVIGGTEGDRDQLAPIGRRLLFEMSLEQYGGLL